VSHSFAPSQQRVRVFPAPSFLDRFSLLHRINRRVGHPSVLCRLSFSGFQVWVPNPSRFEGWGLFRDTSSGAGRTLSAVDTANSINYATAAHYSPAGALASLANAASVVSTLFYSKRLQPSRISVKYSGSVPASCADGANIGNVLDLKYNFSLGSADNGNIVGITNNRDTTRSQSSSYDQLNRIATAKTSSTSGSMCWDEAFGYDAWGNLLSIGRISG